MSVKKSAHEIAEDPDFKALVSQKNTISWILTIAELVIYFGFIALVAFNKPFMSKIMTEGKAMTIGIPIAVGTIILSWVLTGVYIYWANNKYDVLVKNIRTKIGG